MFTRARLICAGPAGRRHHRRPGRGAGRGPGRHQLQLDRLRELTMTDDSAFCGPPCSLRWRAAAAVAAPAVLAGVTMHRGRLSRGAPDRGHRPRFRPRAVPSVACPPRCASAREAPARRGRASAREARLCCNRWRRWCLWGLRNGCRRGRQHGHFERGSLIVDEYLFGRSIEAGGGYLPGTSCTPWGGEEHKRDHPEGPAAVLIRWHGGRARRSAQLLDQLAEEDGQLHDTWSVLTDEYLV